ncbi:hypothetical protein M0R01_02315 [bacterium]|nr:hypothetical protein [bacterium]
MNFLVGITTTEGSDWRKKIEEIKALQIKEVAVFPTCLNKEQRGEFYTLLERSVERIPFVHLRDDMDVTEIEFFIKKFNTVLFNCHASHINPSNKSWEKYKDIICQENHDRFNEQELGSLGGICLDFTHMEDEIMTGRQPPEYYQEILKKYPLKCNHISAIKKNFKLEGDDHRITFGSHYLEDLSEVDYLVKYPLEYFSNYCAIEMENSIERQLEIIEYIKNLLLNRDELIKRIF